MVGRPPDVRALTEHLNCALAVLELQSAGARRSRVTKKKALREVRRAIKNSLAPSGKRIAAHATNRPSYSRPEKEGPRTTRVNIVIEDSTRCQRVVRELRRASKERTRRTPRRGPRKANVRSRIHELKHLLCPKPGYQSWNSKSFMIKTLSVIFKF